MPKKEKPPLCPACGRSMALSRTIEKEYADLTLNVFECSPCRLSYTVAQEEERRGP